MREDTHRQSMTPHQCHTWRMPTTSQPLQMTALKASLTPACAHPAGNNWIDPPKRERKRIVNYAENEYFRNALKASGGGARQSGPRLPKMPQMQDFQFFDTSRLSEIYNKENAHEVHKHQLAQRETALRGQVRLCLGFKTLPPAVQKLLGFSSDGAMFDESRTCSGCAGVTEQLLCTCAPRLRLLL